MCNVVVHPGADPGQIFECEEPANNQVDQLANGCRELKLHVCPNQYDAIILHSDEDESLAEKVKTKLNYVHLKTGDNPKVALYNEVCPMTTDMFDKLDTVLSQTSVILAVITEELVKGDPENRQTVYGTFINFLRDHKRRAGCFIPVYEENPHEAKWIPAMIRPNRGLVYSNFERDLPVIKKTFEFHLSKRKKREFESRQEALASVTQRN
jgi:hypothetical protein